ncbi:5-keto-4-deoxy-D-glucarate aldolase, partial [Arthrobacter sp. Hiyo6]
MSIFNTPGAVGTWVKLPTIESVQILAHAGYDFVVIDQEHAPIDIRTAYQLVNTATAEGLLALVRVAELRPASIQRILDAG